MKNRNPYFSLLFVSFFLLSCPGPSNPSKSSEKAITEFHFLSSMNQDLNQDIVGLINGSEIYIYVPSGTDVTSLIPTISHTGITISPSSGSVQDFSNNVIYYVTAEDGSKSDYSVSVIINKSYSKEITAFQFLSADNIALSQDINGVLNGFRIDVTVPFGTDISALIPRITHTGESLNPESNVALDFTYNVTYKVTAEDSSIVNYVVEVHVEASDSKEITAFRFLLADNPGLDQDYKGVIEGSDITLGVPHGTDLTNLVPSIVHTGESVNPASGSSTDFSSAKYFQVTAANGSTTDYNVTVLIDDSLCDITSYCFKKVDNPELEKDISGSINEEDIVIHVPYGTDITGLNASYKSNGQNVSINSTPQISGQTTNNFTNTLTYIVSAYDGLNSKNYIVEVIIDPLTKEQLMKMISKDEDVTNVDTSSITDMSELFSDNTTFNQDISEWDVSNVTNMKRMFYRAHAFDQDISTWDVGNVTNMREMFMQAMVFNQDISDWDVSNVTTMASMFYNAFAFNQDIGNWDVSNVTIMDLMFYNAKIFNQDISEWNVSNVTYMGYMFSNAEVFNQDISKWDVSKVTDISGMFNGARSFNQSIGNWDVSNVTDMFGMFTDASTFNQDISSWDVSNVTNMGRMFDGAREFDQDISGWDVSKVTNMKWMFRTVREFNQDISGWDVSNVTNMDLMFCGARSFNQDISTWDVSNVTGMLGMFQNAEAFNQDISNWDVSSVETMNYMFSETEIFNQDISGWDVGNVTKMYAMFKDAKTFNQDISTWDVSKVTDMENMFKNAAAFNQDLSIWGTEPRIAETISHSNFSAGTCPLTTANHPYASWND